MALDFPVSPTVGQQYGGYVFDGVKWKVSTTSTAPAAVQPTPPANPTVGDMWFNSTDGTMYFYYNDGSTAQWVESRAPIVANGYYSPNYIINGAMDIWQRGTSMSASGYFFGPDRWRSYGYSGASTTLSQQTFTPGTVIPSFGEAQYFMRILSTNNKAFLEQPIEDVRTLAGQTVTVSFWAKSAAPQTLQFVQFSQLFGTGGSTVVQTVGSAPSITTNWSRYSVTVTLPSVVGKTIGPNSALNLEIGAAINNALDIWGVQVEAGSVATTFRRNANSIQGELAACQRYYWRWKQGSGSGTTARYMTGSQQTTGAATFVCRFPVSMRTNPTSMETMGAGNYRLYSYYNASVLSAGSITLSGSTTELAFFQTTLSSGTMSVGYPVELLGSDTEVTYFGFSSEL